MLQMLQDVTTVHLCYSSISTVTSQLPNPMGQYLSTVSTALWLSQAVFSHVYTCIMDLFDAAPPVIVLDTSQPCPPP